MKQHREYISSIVLGTNDALIELTGVLVGLSFALQQLKLVALTGLVTGVAAALSMAASAYMQARHEDGKDAKLAGTYTGISYLAVVLLLVAPFFIFGDVFSALVLTLIIALVIIAVISYSTARLFGRNFAKQFGEMFVFSLGVATISFVIGLGFRSLFGITIS